jgi:hypothetical protein
MSRGMTVESLDFEYLINPLALDEFLSTYWERRHFRLERRQPNYYQSLIAAADLVRIISESDLRYSAIRLAKAGGHFSAESYHQNFRQFLRACAIAVSVYTRVDVQSKELRASLPLGIAHSPEPTPVLRQQLVDALERPICWSRGMRITITRSRRIKRGVVRCGIALRRCRRVLFQRAASV